jgi:hypothetical protein
MKEKVLMLLACLWLGIGLFPPFRPREEVFKMRIFLIRNRQLRKDKHAAAQSASNTALQPSPATAEPPTNLYSCRQPQ